MSESSPDTKGRPATGVSGREAALFGCCPRCGARTLFAGLIRFAPRCPECGLHFDSFNVGDGPAAFLTLGVGALVTALALWLELSVSPGWWVHVILWLPLTLALVLGGLRVTKAWLIAAEYRHRAGEHRQDGPHG